jgi:hypothetical protein
MLPPSVSSLFFVGSHFALFNAQDQACGRFFGYTHLTEQATKA